MSIVVHEVTKLFGTQKALDKVSFKVNKGEIFGFLGPNGAGKTTMMKIIMGVLPPNEGQVFVNEQDILSNEIAIKKQIGYLAENNPLYYDMYVKEYLTFVASMYQLKNKKKRVDEIVEQTGLVEEQHKLIGSLSKGYKQRVGIAQALIHNPSVLILDEPTSGLDPNQIIEIRNLIAQIGKNKTVLLSTHIMQEVEAICNRVIIINKGKIVADNKKDVLQEELSDKTRQIIFVEFDKSVSIEEVQSIKGVTKVRGIKKMQYLIEATSEEDVRPHIFQFAVKKVLLYYRCKKKKKVWKKFFTN